MGNGLISSPGKCEVGKVGKVGEIHPQTYPHHHLPSRREVGGVEVGMAGFGEVRKTGTFGGLVLGIDIGSSGACALLSDTGDLLDVEDLPTLDSGPACRPEISPALFAAIVRRWQPARAWIEGIGPRPTDGARSAFAFGGSKATIEAVLATLGVPFRTIQPSVWKRATAIPPGVGFKDLARSRAIERWPHHAELFARKLDHDRAEACLIGLAGLQREAAGR